MAEGLVKPQSTYDTIKNRGRDLDTQIDTAVGGKSAEDAPVPVPVSRAVPKTEPKGLVKPSTYDRLKKLVGL
jgi:hypothetical protein